MDPRAFPTSTLELPWAPIQLANLSVAVERRSGPGFNALPTGGDVAPNEAIRYSVNGAGAGISGRATIRVFSERGNTVFNKQAGLTLSGNAWLDSVAPVIPGTYRVEASAPMSSLIPFYSPTGEAFTTFNVSSDAPDPPAGPPGGGGIFGGMGKIVKASMIPLIMLVVFVLWVLK